MAPGAKAGSLFLKPRPRLQEEARRSAELGQGRRRCGKLLGRQLEADGPMAGLPEQLPLRALTSRRTHRRTIDGFFSLACRTALSQLRHGERELLLPQRRAAPVTQGRFVPALMPRKVLMRRKGALLLLQLLLGLLVSEEAVDQLEESHGHSNLHAVNRHKPPPGHGLAACRAV